MASMEMDASSGGSAKGEKKRFEVKKVMWSTEKSVCVTKAEQLLCFFYAVECRSSLGVGLVLVYTD